MAPAPQRADAKRILVFCRFYLIDDFRANLAPFDGDPRFAFRFLADGKAAGTRDTRARFYQAYRAADRCAAISVEDETEIVGRCRYLRNIDSTQAVCQLHAMAIAIGAEMDDFAPDAVLSHMVDDYVTHVCSIMAAKRGARFVGYAFSYFPGKIQLTQGWNGSPFEVRTPEKEEVQGVSAAIRERVFRQNYLQPDRYSWAHHARLVARYATKRLVFKARSILERDALNLHYTVTPYVADRNRIRDYPAGTLFDADWQNLLAQTKSRQPARLVIYMPLAFSPESTIDYWIRDRRAIDYEAMTLDAVGELARSFVVVIKEHIHMQGIRSPEFYRQLRAIRRVVQVPPAAFSNDVLERCDAVVVGGGSVGVEATIRGIPVASYAPHSYWFERSGAIELSLQRLAEWPQQVVKLVRDHRALDEQVRNEFVGHCLTSTVRPRPGQKIWPLILREDLERILLRA